MDREKAGIYRKLVMRGSRYWFQIEKWTRFVRVVFDQRRACPVNFEKEESGFCVYVYVYIDW